MLSEGSIVTICGMVVTIATLYFQNKKNAEQSKARAEDIKVSVDGTVTKLIQRVEAEGVLNVKVASLEATAAEKEQGEVKATLAAAMHDQLAAARALPPDDAKIVNGGKEQPAQVDRIETTGQDSNVRVRKVETVLGDRVEKVEEKLEEKKDK